MEDNDFVFKCSSSPRSSLTESSRRSSLISSSPGSIESSLESSSQGESQGSSSKPSGPQERAKEESFIFGQDRGQDSPVSQSQGRPQVL